ncbi:DNA replication and repair protein RecF [bioreactor metagenome]|uniref:DNA replication and repair protein RecF n=1 Tax=bioreactor metagenome TaxID=1076179 RepID=A0A645AMP4_9ZZZZ
MCQLKPSYFAALSEYAKVLEQKAAILKNYETGGFDEGLFDIYNEKLSKAGAFIIRERFRYIGLLNEAAQVFHHDISSGKERLYVNYIPSPKIEEGFTVQEGAAILFREFSMVKKREIITGLCLAGPHRDNLEFTINQKDARLFCSQGQQRSCVLSLKLAECELFKAEFSQYPVLLLDDIMSELDHSRQDYIINQIRGKQVIITCCGEELFAPVGSKAIFVIKEGRIQKEE